jgi:hypothetical protein
VRGFDTGVVGPDVVAEVARTHPELVVNGGARPRPNYLDPAMFNAECNARTRRCARSATPVRDYGHVGRAPAFRPFHCPRA